MVADELTLQRFSREVRLKAWQALALHESLDPGFLDISSMSRFRELKELVDSGGPKRWINKNLHSFGQTVPFLLSDIDKGTLRRVWPRSPKK